MNEDPTLLEHELRGLQPLPPSDRLQRQLAGILDAAGVVRSRPQMSWWQRLGFNRPVAAFCWGLLSPCAAACLAAMIAAGPWTPAGFRSQPAPSAETGESKVPSGQADASAHGIKAVNVLYQTLDEGVVLDARKEPVRRVRYLSADRVRWHNPQTGAQWEISYPREDVVLIPVEAE